MKVRDVLELALSGLGRRRLRAALTVFGVTIAIGALVAMLSFGRGMQENVTASFRTFDLFNSVTVLPRGGRRGGFDPDEPPRPGGAEPAGERARLDDAAVAAIGRLPGVVTAFPDINFPAMVSLAGQDSREEMRLVRIVPAAVAASRAMKIGWGAAYPSDDAAAAIVSRELCRQLGLNDPAAAVGRTLRLVSISFDVSRLAAGSLGEILSGGGLPFTRETYEFEVAGVLDADAFGEGPSFQNDVIIPPGAASRVRRLPFDSIWDLLRFREGGGGYSAVNVRLASPRHLESVKAGIRGLGFTPFALADQFAQIRTGFLIMDMVLLAVAMIAIVVASLGIVNTMVMAILERYREIGVLKAVGASDGEVQAVFLVESASIGLAGGVLGCGLGWAVSRLIDLVVSYILRRQDVPDIAYFSYPAWLFLGAVGFALLVSLVSGLCPARRAARIDPVAALRRE